MALSWSGFFGPADIMLSLPFSTEPSSITRHGVSMSPSTRADLCITTFFAATTLPWMVPLTITTWERMSASIRPVSPTTSVFSLVIWPEKWPSMRTVSLNESLPSKDEPWSMKAVRPPGSATGAHLHGAGLVIT